MGTILHYTSKLGRGIITYMEIYDELKIKKEVVIDQRIEQAQIRNIT